MSHYTIGIDYGSLSARAVLVDINDGKELASAVYEYPHAVMSEYLPDSKVKLGPDWALQHPEDYLNVLRQTIPSVIEKSNVHSSNIVGIGIDFTSCTIMPVSREGKVLAQYEKYKTEPHAWVKLWKHHAAQPEADLINKIGKKYGFLSRYGGKISSEWMFPKVLQILNEAPHLYHETNSFLEAADWITLQLTGNWIRNNCTLGFKALWDEQHGFPEKAFFKELHPDMENVIEEKFGGEIRKIGESAGPLLQEWSEALGLSPNTKVSVGNVDAHVSASSSKVVDEGKMLMIMGTSTCDITLGSEKKEVEGMCGVVKDGAIPGYYAYESGQNAVGDIFDWFVRTYINQTYEDEANLQGISIHELLEKKASVLKAGESGMVALDWWNGNRSVLVDTNLTGLMLGMTLATKPEEIYRTLIEATAFGKRRIIDSFAKSGIEIKELYACGGLPHKNRLLMQIYADVCQLEIKIASSLQAPALGSAIFAAVAAGYYESLQEASDKMASLKEEVFKPIPENSKIYDQLYAEYIQLHDYFGKGENDVMKRLKKLKLSILDQQTIHA
ncbi:ribulokinase [Pseudalkalibacillus hwajinpoensis]|uniref:ribulokinase n=1 Tax=Guptibacillus hwajinpoensis TaxID=208199 RepID=UPI001CD2F019|nr:ribulokinase [Pseudalkalibacillus hwajinpoensis]MCA0991331.1 ribulokinase [Pseudalkalibacillus hwajinpoensis]